MRQKNTKDTFIYWLVDTRTNTPFYCGKTVDKPERRLRNHISDANRYDRPICRRLRECAGNIRVQIMEIVPVDGDWVAREKRWIEILRFSFPDNANIADGGQGVPGFIQSAETIAKKRASRLGKVTSPETRAKQSAAQMGKPVSHEARVKIGTANAGKIRTDAFRAGRSAMLKALWESKEYRAKISRSRTGRKASAEHRANLKRAWARRREAAQHA